MLNIEEISKRYKCLGEIRWGNKNYYEINSDEPLSLNSYGGDDGWLLNDKGEVEIYELIEAPWQYFLKDKEITREEYEDILEEINYDYEKEAEIGLRTENFNVKQYWGKTLDNYYPHPWYPNRAIKGFEIVNNLPGAKKGVFIELNNINNMWIEIHLCGDILQYSIEDCLDNPEFFKPIYK